MHQEKDLIAKADQPGRDAMKLHPFYKGKIKITAKCCVRSLEDFAIWYTPGVAEPCKAISKQKHLVYEYTNKWNTVAIISDGTRVLGLGDIGPEAALPVMEGKALLFKYLGGVDAFPLCLATKDAEEFIRTVKILQPSLGGINLEDIAQPKCFEILERLQKECDIPVWHDDQQGTAAVILAGLINSLKIVGKKMEKVKIAMVGAGAANICVARLLITYGVNPGNIIMCDSKGALNRNRTELEHTHKEKWRICMTTNEEGREGDIPEIMEGMDVLIALSAPGPGVIKKEWVKKMAKDAIIFACANPIPEIWPWEAKDAGARIVATGRSDFPNQVNNSLGFPGIFRGTLDVRAEAITDRMCISAARELARCAEEKGLSEDHIIPTMEEWEIYPREAVAVGQEAISEGVARVKLTKEELFEHASRIIKSAREEVQVLMKEGFISLPED